MSEGLRKKGYINFWVVMAFAIANYITNTNSVKTKTSAINGGLDKICVCDVGQLRKRPTSDDHLKCYLLIKTTRTTAWEWYYVGNAAPPAFHEPPKKTTKQNCEAPLPARSQSEVSVHIAQSALYRTLSHLPITFSVQKWYNIYV